MILYCLWIFSHRHRETARNVYDQLQTSWQGGKAFLLAQLVRLIEQFIRSDRINITPNFGTGIWPPNSASPNLAVGRITN